MQYRQGGGRFLRRPDWVELVELAGILLFPLLLAWLLPRLRPAVSVGAVALVWATPLCAAAAATFAIGRCAGASATPRSRS